MTTTTTIRAAVLVLMALASLTSAALPQGFIKETKLLAQDVIKMHFLPDGRLLIAYRTGVFKIANPSETPMNPQTFMTITNVNMDGEKGVLSFVLDPNFAANGYFYVWYTPIKPVNNKAAGLTISRFTFTALNPLATETPLWVDPDGTPGPYHYGGDIVIKNNQLYATQGDKFYPETAQDMTKSATCIIRINLDGSVPADNNTPKSEKGCWAWGIRNGWRMSYDAVSGNIYIAEVGGNDQSVASEDIHIAKAGVNFGWPLCEGYCNNVDYQNTCQCGKHDNALFAYNHKDSSAPTGANAAIIGGYVYRDTQFGSATYYGKYFFGDYARGWIKYLPLSNDGLTVTGAPVMFDDYAVGITGMEPGQDGSLWYHSTYGITRVYNANGNQPPVINTAAASKTAGDAPLVVQFTGAAQDPEGQSLTYTWDFGDGTSSNNVNPSKIYTKDGTYSVYLRVSDGQAQTTAPVIKIEVGKKPVVTITSPVDGVKFLATQTITISGNAFNNGVQMDNALLQWNLQIHHDNHIHPGLTGTGPSIIITVPTGGHAFEGDTYYIATLSATNPSGLTTSTSINLYPTEVFMTLASSPSGLSLFSDGNPHVTPYTVDSLINFNHDLVATPAICLNSVPYVFKSWSDGGAASHTISTPASDFAVTATYAVTSGTCTGNGPIVQCAYKGCIYSDKDNCQCDANCQQFGDCCSDFVQICKTPTTTTQAPVTTTTTAKPGAPTTTAAPTTTTTTAKPTAKPALCSAIGCGIYSQQNPCACDSGCKMYGDCCSDIDTSCGVATTGAPASSTTTTTTSTAGGPKVTTTATAAPTTSTAAPTYASCASYGCPTTYVYTHSCQCDDGCTMYGDCCSDRAVSCNGGAIFSTTAANNVTTTTPKPAATTTTLGGNNNGHPGTCSGKCGVYSPSATCNCDTYCADYGDCCIDKLALCVQ